MSASATISAFIATYSVDPDHSSIGFARRQMPSVQSTSVRYVRSTWQGCARTVLR
jgi:hypothetical protein